MTPTRAMPEHIASPDCWCHPVRDSEEPAVWVHNDGTVTAGEMSAKVKR